MANKFTDWMKNNKLNMALTVPAIGGVVSGDNKLKNLIKLTIDLTLGTKILAFQFTKLWDGFGKGIKSALHSTGSLDAALRKLSTIQGLQKMFTSMSGGAASAKVEVAKLVNLAASKGLKFEPIAEAARSMAMLSKGAMGSVRDMNMIIGAAKASGASMSELAGAAGSISAAMASGDSIAGYVEQLRQAGAITNMAAMELDKLQASGGTAQQVSALLSKSLNDVAQSGKSAAESINEVNEAYEAAQDTLKAGAGSPWIHSEIQATKNWTDVLIAVTPVIQMVSGWLEKVFNGMSTTASATVKLATDLGIVQFLIAGLGAALAALVPIISVVASVMLVNWLRSGAAAFNLTTTTISRASLAMQKFTGSATLANGAARVLSVGMRVLNVAMKALAVLAVAEALAQLIGVLVKFIYSANDSAKAAHEITVASHEVNKKFLDQIDHVETLADKYALLNTILEQSAEAWAKYYDALAKGKGPEEVSSLKTAALNLDVAAMRASKKGTGDKSTTIAVAEEESKRSEAQTARDIAMAKASPGQQAALQKQEAKRLELLASQGGDEIFGAADTEKQVGALNLERLERRQNDPVENRKKEAAQKVEEIQNKIESAAARGDYGNVGKNNIALQKARAELAAANSAPPTLDTKDIDEKIRQTKLGSTSKITQAGQIEQDVMSAKNSSNKSGPYAGLEGQALTDKLQSESNRAAALRREGEIAKKDYAENTDAASKAGFDATKREQEVKLAEQLRQAEAGLSTTRAQGYELYLEQQAAAITGIKAEMKMLEEKGHKDSVAYRAKQDALNAIDRDKDVAGKEHALAVRLQSSAEKMAGDKSVGIKRAQSERKQEIEDLQDEFNTAFAQGNPEKTAKARTAVIEARRKNELATVEETKQQLATGRDIQNRRAAATGDASIIQKNQAVSEFQDVFDSVLEATGDQGKAEALGRRAAQDSVNLQGIQMQQAANTSGAVSSLARIGGGGGVEAVDTQIDLMKISNEIQNAISATLVRIELAKKGIKQ